MKKFLILFLIFLFNFACAQNLDEISKKIPKMGSIKCKFKQEKYLKNIEKPFLSNGDFEYIEGKGVYFYTKYPVELKTDYTNEKYKQINDIVSAVSNKKYSKLERDFEFEFSKNADIWSLKLQPKEKSDARNFISSIALEGSDYIQKINILQTNGNKTLIWFTK